MSGDVRLRRRESQSNADGALGGRTQKQERCVLRIIHWVGRAPGPTRPPVSTSPKEETLRWYGCYTRRLSYHYSRSWCKDRRRCCTTLLRGSAASAGEEQYILVRQEGGRRQWIMARSNLVLDGQTEQCACVTPASCVIDRVCHPANVTKS